MKTIGIIGGLSPESTMKYYQWLNEGVKAKLGGHHSAKILFRQFLSKGTDLSDASQEDLDEISHLLNTRPRKALGFKTLREFYMKKFKQYHPDYRCCT